VWYVDRTDHQWTGGPSEKRLTGGGTPWGQSPTMSAANYPMQVVLPFWVVHRMLASVIVVFELIWFHNFIIELIYSNLINFIQFTVTYIVH